MGLSDKGLATLCVRHRIPVPPRGDWQRKANGHPVTQVPLPPMPAPSVIVVGREEKGSLPPPPAPEENLHPAIAFARQPEHRIVVPERLTRTHPLLVSTKKE